jgi:protein SCO1
MEIMNRPNSNRSTYGQTFPRFGWTLILLASLFCVRFAFPRATVAQLPGPIQNIGVRPQLLKQVGVDQKLDESIPLHLAFRDETGKQVELGQYFAGKPVVLSLVYYSCPMLCTQVLNGIERSLRGLSLDLGKDYEVVTVSIDPGERPVLASAKHELYTGMYGRPGGAQGWHFLTGDEPQIKALANAVGFRYAYDPESKQFAHASVIMILTPEGKISKYFYGINYPSRELRLGLVDASEGRIGTPVDAVLLFCYHYDPATGKYGVIISHVIQIAGGITILALAGLILALSRREHYGLPGSRA